MKYTIALFFLLSSLLSLAQVPLTDIEGRLSIYLPGDTTSVHIGKNAGESQDLSTYQHNTFVGTDAGREGSSSWYNSFIGYKAGAMAPQGSFSCFVGTYAGYSNAGSNNNFFGANAGYINLADYNNFFGTDAGFSNQSGNNNSFFGHQSGLTNNDGSSNSFFGSGSGLSNEQGSYNSFFGFNSGRENDAGSRNSFFGTSTGETNMDHMDNSFFGYEAGKNGSGNQNVFLGALSGHSSGDSNVIIGYNSGGDSWGSKNILIGYNSGPFDANIDERLYIDVQQTSDPLIYGEFDNALIRINGDFHSTGKVLLNNSESVSFFQSDNVTEKSVLTVDASDHTSLNAVGDINFNTNGQTAGAFQPMIIKADKKVGIGTTLPLWRTVVKESANAITGGATIDISNLAMVLAKEANDNNEGIGIGFQSSSDEENVGAAIVHERTGASSLGKLHFASKTTTGTGDDIQVNMTISDDGKVGIGNINPIATLDVAGEINGTGLYCNFISACSDERLKRDFSKIDDPISKVKNLTGYYHFWNSKDYPEKGFTEKRQIGVKAQEIQSVLPEVVNTTPEGFLSVEYGKIVPILVEAIKEQQVTIESLQSKIEKQQSQLEKRDKQFASLLSRIEQLENDRLSKEGN